jgi:hypothetical protein
LKSSVTLRCVITLIIIINITLLGERGVTIVRPDDIPLETRFEKCLIGHNLK